MSEKLKALNTIGIWIIVLTTIGYLFFKPDNTLSKDTVTKLNDVVDKLGVASENMTKLANSQRQWFDDLKQQAAQGEFDRNKNYGNLYDRYGYGSDQDAGFTLDDLYNNRMQQQTNNNGSRNVRPVQGTDREDGSVQSPAG